MTKCFFLLCKQRVLCFKKDRCQGGGRRWDEDRARNTPGVLAERGMAFSGSVLRVNQYALHVYTAIIATFLILMYQQECC